MAPLITENIDQIIAACKRHHLKNLYVFGSAVRENDFNEDSDVDFLPILKNEVELLLKNYDGSSIN